MDLWQLLMLIVIGLDVVVQTMRLNRETANSKKLDELTELVWRTGKEKYR